MAAARRGRGGPEEGGALDAVIEMILAADEEEEEELELHPVQLLCLEQCHVECFPCLCHTFALLDAGMSMYHAPAPEFRETLWGLLQGNPSLPGLYFVAYWAAPQFDGVHTTLMPVRANLVRGVLYNVVPHETPRFVSAIAALASGGALPCQYLRKVYALTFQHLLLYTDLWCKDVADAYLEWHKTESDVCEMYKR
ncbi:protein ORF22 [Pigeon adenovirus 1]